MKRQKRDPFQKAYISGYKAGVSGRSRDDCAASNVEVRECWMTGWREGRESQWSGMTGIAGLHKNPMAVR